MVFFKISNNLNIKLSDGALVAYKRYIKTENWSEANIYCTTYSDFLSIQNICKNIKDATYICRAVDKSYFNKVQNVTKKSLPKRFGIAFENEYDEIYKNSSNSKFSTIQLISQSRKNGKLKGYLKEKQLLLNSIKFSKKEIKIAIIGASYNKLGEIINFCSALRVLYEELNKKVSKVKLDVCLQGSDNTYYKRDKELYLTYPFINEIKPLSLSIDDFCSYDYYIDTSSIDESIYYNELPYIDFFLRHFGIDFERIPLKRKYNEISLKDYKVNVNLKEKIKELRENGNKILLFHPYSAKTNRSVPVDISKKMVYKLESYAKNYQLVSSIKISGLKNSSLIDLSSYSKSFFDFVYIISQVDCVITVDTSTYHISDALFIPTVVIFTNEEIIEKRLKYCDYVEGIVSKQNIKSLSKFIFRDNSFYIDNQNGWLELKVSKIIDLLEKIG